MARKCINCESHEEMTRFEHKTFVIEHGGSQIEVKGLAGWRCGACDEVEFDADSARRYGAAGDELVLRERKRQSKEIRRSRRKLGLSQIARRRSDTDAASSCITQGNPKRVQRYFCEHHVQYTA